MLLLYLTENTWFIYLFFLVGIWKEYCHIWNQHPQIFLFAKFPGKIKIPKFGTKDALLGYFRARNLKSYCHIWKQHLRICWIAKFCEENKMPKFGSKNVLFEYSWPKRVYLGIFGLELKIKLLSYLKSAPSNLSICKISQRNKKHKFGTKNVWFGYFWVRIFKNAIVIFEINTLKFVSLQNFAKKNKNTWIWDQKYVIWVFLGSNF